MSASRDFATSPVEASRDGRDGRDGLPRPSSSAADGQSGPQPASDAAPATAPAPAPDYFDAEPRVQHPVHSATFAAISPHEREHPKLRTRIAHAGKNDGPASPASYAPPNRMQTGASFASASGFFSRPKRSNTVRTYNRPKASEPNWEPGAEPGIDTTKDDNEQLHKLFELCDITVIDFSDTGFQEYRLDNDPYNNTFQQFLEQERPKWAECRWICVNGLSWDVIKLLGNLQGLHRLAIEDLISTKTRTKADWYADHCYMVMTLQKLVRLHSKNHEEAEPSNEFIGADYVRRRQSRNRSLWRKLFPMHDYAHDSSSDSDSSSTAEKPPNLVAAHSSTSSADPVKPVKTLQMYHGSDREHVDYIQAHSPLSKEGLAVSVEQVSLFMTQDNTVISFFEHSAVDILAPITARLRSNETILRRSSDASMLCQAIIDAIIDLAMPVAAAYDEAIARLEFDVLMDPDMSQPKQLYILASEITLLKNTIQPIASLVNALRRADPTAANTLPSTPATGIRPRPSAASYVSFTPLARTYLGDVEDHCFTLTANLERLTASAEQLTNLIFNTMSAYQNESMKQLTLVTIFFLPLTFLTGYFGMNFYSMYSVNFHTDAFFWYIAIPVQVCVSVYLMRGMISRAWRRAEVSLYYRRRRKQQKQRHEM